MHQIGWRRSSWIAAIAIAALLVAVPSQLHAQRRSRATLFEDIVLPPRFRPDPLFLDGISGGTFEIAAMSDREDTETGSCVGFVQQTPDHRLELTAEFASLHLQVFSSDDTTLLVRGPGGSWCNDDFEGKNPGIAGKWLAGTYEIWVGSYHRDEYHPYTIQISQIQLPDPGAFPPNIYRYPR